MSEAEIKKKVQRYMDMEKEVMEKEAKNIPKGLQAKKEQMETLKKSVAELEAAYKVTCDKV